MQAWVRATMDRKKRGRHYFVGRYAKVLASSTYLLFMSFDEVYDAIDREYGKLVGDS